MSRYYLGVTINQVPRFYAYQDQACADAEAALRALTPAQRLAQTSLAAPAAPTDATWQVRNCNAAASVTAVSCVQVGNTTVITVTATAPCEINITAVSGGAQWGDATAWYATTLVSGTTYTKTWTFLFVAGLYHIRARVTGTTDATKYVACDFTATAATGGGGGVSATLDAHLGPEPAWTGQTFVSHDGNSDLMAIVVAENADRKLIFSNSVPYSSSTAFEIYLLDGRGSNAQPEGASRAELATMLGERGVQHTIERRQIKNGTPPNLWNNQNYMEGAPCISQVIRY